MGSVSSPHADWLLLAGTDWATHAAAMARPGASDAVQGVPDRRRCDPPIRRITADRCVRDASDTALCWDGEATSGHLSILFPADGDRRGRGHVPRLAGCGGCASTLRPHRALDD